MCQRGNTIEATITTTRVPATRQSIAATTAIAPMAATPATSAWARNWR